MGSGRRDTVPIVYHWFVFKGYRFFGDLVFCLMSYFFYDLLQFRLRLIVEDLAHVLVNQIVV